METAGELLALGGGKVGEHPLLVLDVSLDWTGTEHRHVNRNLRLLSRVTVPSDLGGANSLFWLPSG